MPRGYKRRWFAVESEIIDHPKWMVLAWSERGKWLAVRALAERQTTACFKDRVHLATLLMKEGDPTPDETIDRLVEVRLLDLNDDGSISVHDLEDYGIATSTERVIEHRKRNETDRNTSKRLHTDRHTYTGAAARPAGAGASAPAREGGESLKAYLERIGAPIPDVANKEATNGKNGTEGSSDADGKSRRRPRKRAAAPE